MGGPSGHSVSVEQDGVARCTALVAVDGAWSCVASVSPAGTHALSAVQGDAAGNRSVASAPQAVALSL